MNANFLQCFGDLIKSKFRKDLSPILLTYTQMGRIFFVVSTYFITTEIIYVWQEFMLKVI
jgi:hypothetical protein